MSRYPIKPKRIGFTRNPAFNYRQFYNQITDVRTLEIDVPEEFKTLKTETFLAIEKEIRLSASNLGF